MTKENIEKLLDIGTALSAEQDFDALLEMILEKVMELTNCDAGTLYLLKDELLHFRIIRNNTLHTYQGGDGKRPKLPPVPLNGENVCSLALLEDKVICIDDVRTDSEYDSSVPIRYDEMTGYHTKSMLVIPMKNRNGKKIGVLQLINALDKEGVVCGFDGDLVKAVESVASQAAMTIQNVRYTKEIKGLFWSFIRVMSSAVDERTPYNLSHTKHMAEYGERFIAWLNKKARQEGREAPFSPEHREELLMSIWLHDIGKLVTPLEVMNKESRLAGEKLQAVQHRLELICMQAEIDYLKGMITENERKRLTEQAADTGRLIEKTNRAETLTEDALQELERLHSYTYEKDGRKQPFLTEEEYGLLCIRKGTLSDAERKVMERHVVITEKLLSKIHFSQDLSHVKEWAAGHHEMLDGNGYPRHLAGAEIPKEVRIITILDIFDALVADDRPYKPGMPVEKALSILKEMAEKEGKLDQELVSLFIQSRCWEA